MSLKVVSSLSTDAYKLRPEETLPGWLKGVETSCRTRGPAEVPSLWGVQDF